MTRDQLMDVGQKLEVSFGVEDRHGVTAIERLSSAQAGEATAHDGYAQSWLDPHGCSVSWLPYETPDGTRSTTPPVTASFTTC